jgi:alpha-ribazole phosphatase
MAQIYLVRHTKVDVPQGVCYGTTDVKLAPAFQDEFATVKGKLQGKKFKKIYSSPLSRCTKLAEFIAPKQFIEDSRLSELHFGEWEMKLWDDVFQSTYGKEWMDNYQTLPCPGGESYPDLFKRVSDFIRELKGDDLLIITHSGVIRVFLCVFKNISLQEAFNFQVDFGEVIEITEPL